MRQLNFCKKILIMTIFFTPCFSLAWGERGHHTICEVAVRLVKDPKLASFMKERSHMMGHVCNIPDIYWKSLGEISKPGDSTHFLNPENLDYTMANLPTDFKKIFSEKQNKYSATLHRNIDVAQDLGSSWWRYNQFYKLAVNDGKTTKNLNSKIDAAIKNGDPSVNSLTIKYNASVLSLLTNMGLMGHFVGDASQPYHNTNDYDGWNTQQGGIHSYYESRLVDEMPLSLPQDVFNAAKTLAASQKTVPKTAIDKIRNVSLVCIEDLPKIRVLDVVLEPSKIVTDQNGIEHRTAAKRKPPSETVNDFKPLIIHELAQAALALAQTWDAMYSEAGKPSFEKYHSYEYPLKPDYIAPNYIPQKISR